MKGILGILLILALVSQPAFSAIAYQTTTSTKSPTTTTTILTGDSKLPPEPVNPDLWALWNSGNWPNLRWWTPNVTTTPASETLLASFGWVRVRKSKSKPMWGTLEDSSQRVNQYAYQNMEKGQVYYCAPKSYLMPDGTCLIDRQYWPPTAWKMCIPDFGITPQFRKCTPFDGFFCCYDSGASYTGSINDGYVKTEFDLG